MNVFVRKRFFNELHHLFDDANHIYIIQSLLKCTLIHKYIGKRFPVRKRVYTGTATCSCTRWTTEADDNGQYETCTYVQLCTGLVAPDMVVVLIVVAVVGQIKNDKDLKSLIDHRNALLRCF